MTRTIAGIRTDLEGERLKNMLWKRIRVNWSRIEGMLSENKDILHYLRCEHD